MSALADRIVAHDRVPLDAPTLRALIDARAGHAPDKPFLLSITQDDALTFGALRDDCIALEARFTAAGLRSGDVVSVFMGNGIQTARLLLAAMYSGLVANPLNLLCQPSQVRYIVEHSDTRAIFVADDTHDIIVDAIDALRGEGMTREIAVVRTSPDSHALPDIPMLPARAIPLVRDDAPGTHIVASDTGAMNAGDTALLMYTSGTTGAPKGVLLSHRSLLANMRNISAEHRLTEDDRVLVSLPLYHINGLVVALLTPLYHGGSAVMTPRFSARTFWSEASQHGCTWINVVPTIVAYLLNGEGAQGCDLSALKFCRSASAALPADHHRAFEARFGIGVIETMGMTETAAPAFSNPYEPTMRRIGSIGLPSGGEAKIVGLDGRECAAHETGELVLRGEQLMSGYYKRPDETRNAFTADGWLRTGDLGYRDEAGFFYINGRAKELIIKGGENIAPREIDEALLRHPGVLEAAAVGVPDPAYGQDIVAFIVPCGGAASLDVADLRAHCLRELGRYKTPREFRFTDALPRGPSGKVQRLKLVQSAPPAG
ncbi:long-chain-fatty-acid--CoA ligase [Caballeronia calidae]|uniref:Long-chain-fatty-acid--CoA ligase n=1 Tax=Caballeronia calidae TaxID=1777139 RepID=A0A158DXU5_9BURK|nr:AMP-binding protein [Caballeronia calidae]SAK99432.1 long-chain-fatty-acid--CoA ligase [Caballeronia calidae]